MKLIGNLRKQVEETNCKEEAKKIIENAGMLLTDEELNIITAGGLFSSQEQPEDNSIKGICKCGQKGEIGHVCPCCGSQYTYL